MNVIRCVFKKKVACIWNKDEWKCTYPARMGPHLFDGKCDSYRPSSGKVKK